MGCKSSKETSQPISKPSADDKQEPIASPQKQQLRTPSKSPGVSPMKPIKEVNAALLDK